MRWLIEREGDELLNPEDEGVKDEMRKLPGAVESWTREKMSQLAGLLPASRHVGVDTAGFCDDLAGDAISIDSPPPVLEESDESDLHLLNLATSVFTCLGSTTSSIRAGPRLRCGALQTQWDRRLHFSVYVYLLLCSSSLGKEVLIEIQVLHYMEKESELETHSHSS